MATLLAPIRRRWIEWLGLKLDIRSKRCLLISVVFHVLAFVTVSLSMAPRQGSPESFLIPVGVFSEQPATDDVAGRENDPTQPQPNPEEEVVAPEVSPNSQDIAAELVQKLPTDSSEIRDYLAERDKKILEKKQKIAQLKQMEKQISGNLQQRSRYGTLEPRTFYGVKVFERNILFVLDISGSMDIGEARLQLKNAYHALGPQESFNIIAYNNNLIIWKEGLVLASQENKKQADQWVTTIYNGGNTDIYSALQIAFTTAWKSIRTDSIYLVTDGLPTAGPVLDPFQIIAAVRKWNQGKNISIHVIGVGPQQDRPFLKTLAEQNYGRYSIR